MIVGVTRAGWFFEVDEGQSVDEVVKAVSLFPAEDVFDVYLMVQYMSLRAARIEEKEAYSLVDEEWWVKFSFGIRDYLGNGTLENLKKESGMRQSIDLKQAGRDLLEEVWLRDDF